MITGRPLPLSLRKSQVMLTSQDVRTALLPQQKGALSFPRGRKDAAVFKQIWRSPIERHRYCPTHHCVPYILYK